MDNHIQHDQAKELFYIENSEDAYLKYSIKDDVITMSSTYVDPKYRGQQYARKLVEAGVEFAKSKQLKINPTCSYALKVVKENYPDLMV